MTAGKISKEVLNSSLNAELSQFAEHLGNDERHLVAEERGKWNTALMPKDTIILVDTDWNTITTTGMYDVAIAGGTTEDKHAPPQKYGYGALTVMENTRVLYQLYIPHFVSEMCYRLKYGDGWSEWNEVVIKKELHWYTPELWNGWGYFGMYSSIGFSKDELGFVHLKGFVKDGLTAAGTVIFYLPIEFRPAESLVFSSLSSNGTQAAVPVTIEVRADGYVLIGTPSGNTWLALDGISFKSA